MTRHPSRTAARALPALLGTGVLALAACGGSGDGGGTGAPTSASPTASATAGPTSDAPSSAGAPSAGASSGADTAPASESAGDPATGTPGATDGASAEIEAALVAVLGEDAQIVSGEDFERLAGSAQGLAEGMTVTPEECGQEGLGGQTGQLSEGTQVIGGVVVDATDPASPRSDMLSVATFPDDAAASEALAAYEDFATRCPDYTVEMGDGITADATVELVDVRAEVDDALALTIGTAVDIEGVELPAGTESTTTTSLYVRDGERLVSYAGSGAGDAAVPVEDALEAVDALRAELDG